MPEVQTSQPEGESTQKFLEFVLMHARQAAFFLGQIPGHGGERNVDLEAARMFIDQLEVIREKTRGNLNRDEAETLQGVLANLQMVFVQVAQAAGSQAGEPIAQHDDGGDSPAEEPPGPAGIQPPPAAPPKEPAAEETPTRKKFTKSYGS